jgi:hypothetical protein
MLRVLWSRKVTWGWDQFSQLCLPLPESGVDPRSFRGKYARPYEACLQRALAHLGVTYSQPFRCSVQAVGEPDQEKVSLAMDVVQSMVYVLDDPGFVRDVSRCLGAVYFRDVSLDLLVAQVQGRRGFASWGGAGAEPGAASAGFVEVLARVLPEIGTTARLSDLAPSWGHLRQKGGGGGLIPKLMLVALNQVVGVKFRYAGEAEWPAGDRGRSLAGLLRQEVGEKDVEDVEEREASVLGLTVRCRRRAVVVVRHDIKTVFLLDPMADKAVEVFVAAHVPGHYMLCPVVRARLRGTWDWGPAFVVAAASRRNPERDPECQRIISRFNAEARDSERAARDMHRRLFRYVTGALVAYGRGMEEDIRGYFPGIVALHQ